MDKKAIIYDAKKKSVGIAYALLLLLGTLGAHRFYLGHSMIGATLLASTIVVALDSSGRLSSKPAEVHFYLFILLIAGILISDLFRLPGMIGEANVKIAEEIESQ